jgi:uncharacterized protein (DUF1501 family)
MNPHRRSHLKRLSGLGLASLGGALGLGSVVGHSASLPGYKALVVVHLQGGHDGHDLLVPMDGAYTDYTRARESIALAQSGLTAFARSHLDQRLGLNNALAPLMPLFERQQLAFLVNAGPLVQPATAADVLNRRVAVPPFLFSHPEQSQYVQGWMGDEDPSGWAGRAMEALGPTKAPLVSVDQGAATLVLGQRSRMVSMNSYNSRWVGPADLASATNPWTQTLAGLTRLQSPVTVETELARSLRATFLDAQELSLAGERWPEPQANFEANDIGRRLRAVARFLPYYRSAGASRQVFSLEWGQFDTHANQRYTGESATMGLDPQLAQLASALVAFNDAVTAAGMANEVVLLVISEFGRTLDPASGRGSDHAWGNHWMAMGGPVRGAQMYGARFPRLLLGGPDDGDPGRRGYFVPQMSTDQVAADALAWLGVPLATMDTVMPNLRNFTQKTVGYLHV